jgi:hypothetical protein
MEGGPTMADRGAPTGGAGTLATVAGGAPDADSGGGPTAVGDLVDVASARVVVPVAGEGVAGAVGSLVESVLVVPLASPGAAEPAVGSVLVATVVDPVELLAVVAALPLPFAEVLGVGVGEVFAVGAGPGAGAGAGAGSGAAVAGGVATGGGSGGGVAAGAVAPPATWDTVVRTVVVVVVAVVVAVLAVLAVSAADAFVLAALATNSARGAAASRRRLRRRTLRAAVPDAGKTTLVTLACGNGEGQTVTEMTRSGHPFVASTTHHLTMLLYRSTGVHRGAAIR